MTLRPNICRASAKFLPRCVKAGMAGHCLSVSYFFDVHAPCPYPCHVLNSAHAPPLIHLPDELLDRAATSGFYTCLGLSHLSRHYSAIH
mmetsp:Transcript_711/g.1061  ORF Transcript_711/g.1061 Transcript_711/m.1061 type:complete len:89 (+) Transcript_711:680-946(+)